MSGCPRRGGRWGTLAGLGLAAILVALLSPGRPRAAETAEPGAAPMIHTKKRAFRIPITVAPAEKSKLREVRLFRSVDAGRTWEFTGRTTPDRPIFNFRATSDGEYWFAVRTLDMQGRVYPGDNDPVEPSLKVVVDTVPPTLTVQPQGRRGGLAAVLWNAQDDHLDLGSLAIEYQGENAAAWRQVPVHNPAPHGSKTWDPGTSGPLRLRGSVADRAGNVATVQADLSGDPVASPTADARPVSEPFEANEPPPIEPISSRTPLQPLPGVSEPDPFGAVSEPPQPPQPPSSPDPFGAGDPFASSGSGSMPSAPTVSVPPPAGAVTQLVANPRFPLRYEVEDAGPDGPASVELWVTRDGGRTWSRMPEDADRTSPYQVDLGADGTYGLSLVARSATGQGDHPPVPGETPQMWVEVDTTPPVVQLDAPRVGTGIHAGKVAILWRASDMHLGPKPVVISYRPDQADAPWQPITERLDNTGMFVWNVPPNVPAKIHLRVDIQDAVGNRTHVDTTATGPVLVDRSRPKGRILGLDQNQGIRTGAGANPAVIR